MKKIYIILTYTGTFLSKIIRGYTKDEYCHVSIALDEDLEQMYSFGRLNPYNPFIGGFVHEGLSWGTFKRFQKTKAKIIAIEISNKKYNKVKKVINEMAIYHQKYSFNIIGLIGVGFHLKIRFKNSFYCAEFIEYIIKKAKINISLPKCVKPMDFANLNVGTTVYEGFLNQFRLSTKNC